MAPDLALDRLVRLPTGSVVLDPMAGSGTVLQEACSLGMRASGFDLDPLAVILSRVTNGRVDNRALLDLGVGLVRRARAMAAPPALEWIDSDPETLAFVEYWFGEEQRADLRRLAAAMEAEREGGATIELEAAMLALSRLIIVKEKGASLARDAAHSRPHRVGTSTVFDVLPRFEKSLEWVRARLSRRTAKAFATVGPGDCRKLPIAAASVDAIVTSPPYLNAIDYMRGHRLSLVWFGHRVAELRGIRGASIGTERRADATPDAIKVRAAMGDIDALPRRLQGIVDRYAADLISMTREMHRVLARGGEATLVVGNSCLKGIFVNNADAVAEAARMAGLEATERADRDLPPQHRYLPLSNGSLAKRMRTETVMSFRR